MNGNYHRYEHPKQRLANGAILCLRVRRRLAVIATLDIILLSYLGIALLWMPLHDAWNFYLRVAHGVHLFTSVLCYAAVYATAYSADVLRALKYIGLLAITADGLVLCGRLFMLTRAIELHDRRTGEQFFYILLAGAFLCVDFGIVYYAGDAQRATVMSVQQQQQQQQQSQQQHPQQMQQQHYTAMSNNAGGDSGGNSNAMNGSASPMMMTAR